MIRRPGRTAPPGHWTFDWPPLGSDVLSEAERVIQNEADRVIAERMAELDLEDPDPDIPVATRPFTGSRRISCFGCGKVGYVPGGLSRDYSLWCPSCRQDLDGT
jgi:hypothetical protein